MRVCKHGFWLEILIAEIARSCSFFKSIGLREFEDNAEIAQKLLRRDLLPASRSPWWILDWNWSASLVWHVSRSQPISNLRSESELDTQIIRDRCRLFLSLARPNPTCFDRAIKQNNCPKKEPACMQAKQMRKRRACVQATVYQTQPTGLNYVVFWWFLVATAASSC